VPLFTSGVLGVGLVSRGLGLKNLVLFTSLIGTLTTFAAECVLQMLTHYTPRHPCLRGPHFIPSQCSRIRILRFFFSKLKKRDFYVFSNNDRQCLLHLEVYQIASLHCALWNNKQLHIHTTLYEIVD